MDRRPIHSDSGRLRLDQPSSNLSYDEAEKLVSESPLLSATAVVTYSFNATADSGALEGTDLQGELVAQTSDYPKGDYLPAFSVFEGQLGLADGVSLEASGLIIEEMMYVFFTSAEDKLFIRGKGSITEDGSFKGPFSALVNDERGEGTWEAAPLKPSNPEPENPEPENPEPSDPEPEEPAPEPEEPGEPEPAPEEPEDPQDPEMPENPEPEDPQDPEPENPEDPEPEDPEEPTEPGGDLPAPPETINDGSRNGDPEVTLSFYNDEIAVYLGEGMNPDTDWMNGYTEKVWKHVKDTYGSFGPDPRLYVIAHKNSNPGYATISPYFDDTVGYRNAITLGGSWNWEEPSATNYEVITHEIAHIVEGANNNVKESPSFEFWGDSKWAEIFMYDVYKALDKDDWAQDWFERMQNSTGGYADAYAFRDWYYPIYEKGGAEAYDRYFELLAECFPKKEYDYNDISGLIHERRATPGEVLHFFSGAVGEDLSGQFEDAFGLTDEVKAQFEEARSEMSCAATY